MVVLDRSVFEDGKGVDQYVPVEERPIAVVTRTTQRTCRRPRPLHPLKSWTDAGLLPRSMISMPTHSRPGWSCCTKWGMELVLPDARPKAAAMGALQAVSGQEIKDMGTVRVPIVPPRPI